MNQKGFSLIEIIVVATIIGVLSTTLILNFRSGSKRTALRQAAQQLAADIRRAQTTAVVSKRYLEKTRCGYGVRYVGPDRYAIYTGPDSRAIDCSVLDRNFDGGDSDVEIIKLLSVNVEFISAFPDIFFEPPDPKTYINNDASLSAIPAQIMLSVVGGSCPNDCKSVVVTPAGLVEIQ